MLIEFKKFVTRGNVLDLAVGVIIGGAFGKIVSSLVNDLIMPIVGLVLGGRTNFTDFFVPLNGQTYASLQAARFAGATATQQRRSIAGRNSRLAQATKPITINLRQP